MFRKITLSFIRSLSLYKVMLTACDQAVSKPVRHIPLLCVQRKPPDVGQSNCPKHVDFYSINKFEELVHLDGFIIRIYHVARSPERQIIIMSLRTSSYICDSNREECVSLLQACERFPLPPCITYCVRIYCSLSDVMRMRLHFSLYKLVSNLTELPRLPQTIILPGTLKT